MFVVIGSMLTVNNKIFYEYIYEPIKLSTNELVNNVLSIAPQAGPKQFANSKQAIDKIDASFSDLVELIRLVAKKAGIVDVFYSGFVGVIIWGLFTISEAMFTLYLVGNILKLSAISALSPLLILAFAFDGTRSHAIGGLKYVLATTVTLFIASFCMALILLILRKFVLDLNVEALSSDQVSSTLTALLILGVSSIYFLKLAPEMASAIMGVHTSSIMAGVIGGAMASAASLTGWRTASIAGTVGNKIVEISKWFMRAMGNNKNASGTGNSAKSRFTDNYQPTKG